MANIINKSRSLSGFTFIVRVAYLQQQILINNKYEKFMASIIKNEVYNFAYSFKHPRQILDINENEVALFDLRINNAESALQLATSISHNINKAISLNACGGEVSFYLGIVENNQFYQDFDSLLENGELACLIASQKKKDIYLINRSETPSLNKNYYSQEVEHLLQPNSLRYLFRPCLDVSNKTILGYFQYVKAYNSPFSSYLEMVKYASTVDKSRQLFDLVMRNVITKFASEVSNKNENLFLQISVLDIDYIADILQLIPEASDINLVLVLDEQELHQNDKDLESLNSKLLSLKELFTGIGLLLRDKRLLLNPMIYQNFDYFIAGSKMIGEIKGNNRIRLSIHTLIEQLLTYHKPIIATDLEGWQSIELIIKSGISIISGETLSPSNDMFLPLEKKKIEKLYQMYDKYK